MGCLGLVLVERIASTDQGRVKIVIEEASVWFPSAKRESRMRMNRLLMLILLLGLAAPALLGCGQDEIRSYDAPKPQAVQKIKERMLAALIPHGEQMWVLKLQGPEAMVTDHKMEFDSVLNSLHFTNEPGKPVTWKTPPGWKDEPGDRMRFATLRLEADGKVELAISELPASDILANVNRWRGQLALPPVEQAELPNVTSKVKVDGVDATVVDFTGTGGGKKMRPFAGHPPTPAFAGNDNTGAKEESR